MKGYGLKNIPPDVFKFIIEQQNAIKELHGTNKYSFECTLYKILREHPKFIEFKNRMEINRTKQNDAC
jgi:hypothetical protein